MVVRIERPDDQIALVVLDDPARRNAMTEAMADRFAEAMGTLGTDPRLRAVVVTGAPPAFSAGGDLDMLAEHAHRARDEDLDTVPAMRRFYDRFLSVRAVPVPVIAAVNGPAIGAGLCVALACDLRIAATDARLGLPFARLGLYPGMGATWLLPRAVGAMRAAHLLYTGATIDGDEAARIGLCLRSVPGATVVEEALQTARSIAESSPMVVRQLKARLAEAASAPELSTILEVEAATQAISYRSEDLAEGLAAADARRRPVFPGR
jgi:enoyl-CoA hydratase